MYTMYNKYIKYKIKYNNLKHQYAGEDQIKNILLVSHSSTIRCFLQGIISKQMNLYRTNGGVDKVRFKNSAVLLLEIRKDKTVFIKLVYEGNMAQYKDGNKYFTTNPHNLSDILFLQTEIPFESLNIDIPPTNYNIFIVRHSQAAHNVNKLNKLPDALLTPKGHIEASDIGLELRKILNENKINYLFASNLKRSRQTIDEILKKVNFDPVDIVILPCMHDIKAGSDGACFQKKPEKISIAGRMSCTNTESCSSGSVDSLDNKYCCKTDKVTNNWVYYNFTKDTDCTKKNIIQIIFEYIKDALTKDIPLI
jgi:broad specificity phosphatase PhoE